MRLSAYNTSSTVRNSAFPSANFRPLPVLLSCSILTLFICFFPGSVYSQDHTVDFESIAEGQRIDEVSSIQGYEGIEVYGAHDSCPLRNTAIAFNSSCPDGCTGNDDDLGSPNESFGGPGVGVGGEAGNDYANTSALGNLLIIHQYCKDLDTLPVQNPRNYGGASELTLTFPTRVTFTGLTLVDIEVTERLEVEYFDGAGASLGIQSAPATGDNGVVVLQAASSSGEHPSGVRKLVITREGSGAIDNLTFIPESADLSLTARVDNPAPDMGNEVTFTFTLKNDGPDDATGVSVDYNVPSGLTSASSGKQAGSGISWAIGSLAVGDSTSYSFKAVVDADTTMEVMAEVATSDQHDPDSTPGNHVAEEDDQDSAVVTPGQSSGGGDGGIESDGNMATLLARRLFHRRIDAQAAQALKKAPEAILFDRSTPAFLSKTGAAANDLHAAIPNEGPLGTLAYEVTPGDLIDVTNATSVLSVDYLKVSGRRLGAIFSAISPSGYLYDHSKSSCDRLGGGRLEDVRLVEINSHPFVLSTLVHLDGSVDYSISFVAYRTGDTYYIDSRFAPDEYEIPADAEEIVNLQIWGVAPTFTEQLTAQFLERLSNHSNVVYQNQAAHAPRIFVVDGRYEQGKVFLRFVNKVGAADVTLRGSIARTEADAASNTRIPFEHSVVLESSTSEQLYQTAEIELGPLFDVTLFVEHDDSRSFDQLYHADGAWSYSYGDASQIEHFEVRKHEEQFAASTYAIERSGSLTGNVTDWASLFKYLRPNGRPVDLDAYSHLSFIAWGQGDVRLILEKNSIETWDQYGYTITLTPEKKYYHIPFRDLRKETSHERAFTAEDLTLLAFYALGDGKQAAPFSMNFEQLAFGGAKIDGAPELPLGFALEQNFPNPFNPTTQITFTLERPMPVRLSIFDMLGREVAVLIDELQPEGRNSVTFNAENLPSGLYLYRLETPKGNTARIMSLLR